jgi:hypothetical protein
VVKGVRSTPAAVGALLGGCSAECSWPARNALPWHTQHAFRLVAALMPFMHPSRLAVWCHMCWGVQLLVGVRAPAACGGTGCCWSRACAHMPPHGGTIYTCPYCQLIVFTAVGSAHPR